MNSSDAAALELLERVQRGHRVSEEEIALLLTEADLLPLGMTAHAIRKRLHPHPRVTYVVDRNINYTNICVSGCAFCAYYRAPGDPEGFVLSRDELHQKVAETIALGGTQILLQGGLHPGLSLDDYCAMLADLKEHFTLHLHAFSPPEIIHMARVSGQSLRDTLIALKNSGLDSIPGGGAEILSDRVRRELSPQKCTKAEWLEVMRAAHQLGLRTTATMMFGHVESPKEIAEHLIAVRSLQDETGGFTAFIPWTFQASKQSAVSSQQSAVADQHSLPIEPATAHEYLKVLAVSRIALDNVPNIQASWVTQGGKVAQVALFFGANDMGSTMIEENVVRAAGVEYRLPRREIVRLIEDAGFTAVQRDTFYRPLSGFPLARE